MAITDLDLLTSSPGPMARHPHSGARYHEGADIIAHLNRSLGPAGWSWTTGEHGYDELADQVFVVGTLTARLTVLDAAGDELVIGTAHTERGWQTANRRKNDGSFVDLGNDYKAADTDALKRAARLLGVGLDAWMKATPSRTTEPLRSANGVSVSSIAPERPAQPMSRPNTNVSRTTGPLPTSSGLPVSPKPEPLAVDLSPSRTAEPLPAAQGLSASAREDLAARYVDLLAQARGLDFRASWIGADYRQWTDAQLGKYTSLLENYLARQSGAA